MHTVVNLKVNTFEKQQRLQLMPKDLSKDSLSLESLASSRMTSCLETRQKSAGMCARQKGWGLKGVGLSSETTGIS